MAQKEEQPGLKLDPKPPEIPPAPASEDKPPTGYSEDEWEGLSPTEKEGIRESISDPEGDEHEESLSEAELKVIADGEKTEEQKAADAKAAFEAEAKKKVDEEAAAAKKKAEADQAAKTAEQLAADKEAEAKRIADEALAKSKPAVEEGPAVSDEDLLKFKATVTESELSAVDKISADVQKKLDELDVKYDAGDIDLKAYNKDRDALNRQVVQENIRAQNETRTEIAWQKEQGHFLRSRAEYLGEKQADGKFKANIRSNALFGALGEAVKSLEAERPGLAGMELLIEADRVVKETFGLSKSKGATKASSQPEGEKPPARIPDTKTLSDIPAAAANMVGGPWDALDKLHGAAYESALEKLTEEQKQRYLDAR